METQCEVCGNHYNKCFEVISEDESHVFDSFECAIHALAPFCDHCGCRVLGHGEQVGEQLFCCAHCRRQASASGEGTQAE